MKPYRVAILGATGMVGQKFITLLNDHPWFSIIHVAASGRSAGKTYRDAINGRWTQNLPIPNFVLDMVVKDVIADAEAIANDVDLVFSALAMPKEEIRRLEEYYAKLECAVISNNSAHRWTVDVPMVIPEINPDHTRLIDAQRKRLGTTRGFIAAKSNCSLQSYVPALHPLRKYGLEQVLVCTYQAISGAGKTFKTWPEMEDNCIPFIEGEEEKSEREPMKLWGELKGGYILPASAPDITSQCIRVPCSDGHLAACFMRFRSDTKPSIEAIRSEWECYANPILGLDLPSAPKKFLHYMDEQDRPQTKPDRTRENGMGITIGRLRPDRQYDYKFVCLSHNTLRGAAGGAVLLAELLCKQGYIQPTTHIIEHLPQGGSQ